MPLMRTAGDGCLSARNSVVPESSTGQCRVPENISMMVSKTGAAASPERLSSASSLSVASFEAVATRWATEASTSSG